MLKLIEVAAATALLACSAGVASAQDWNGAEQIVRGDYAAAERVITAQQRQFPHDVDLTLNLARVYLATNRAAEAQELYRAVALQPDEELDMPGGRTGWSRELAATALRRLADARVAAR